MSNLIKFIKKHKHQYEYRLMNGTNVVFCSECGFSPDRLQQLKMCMDLFNDEDIENIAVCYSMNKVIDNLCSSLVLAVSEIRRINQK